MFEKGYRPTEDEVEKAEEMMEKEEREMSIEREKYHREPIESLEEFDEEYELIWQFVESLKKQFPEGLQPFEKGFWKKLQDIIIKLERGKESPVLFPLPKKTPDLNKLSIESAANKVGYGGSKIKRNGIFLTCLWKQYIIDQIKEKNLVSINNIETIKNALPHWSIAYFESQNNVGTALPTIDCNRSAQTLLKVLEREISSLESIKNSSDGKEIDELIKNIHKKTSAFNFAVMTSNYPEIREKAIKEATNQQIDQEVFSEFGGILSWNPEHKVVYSSPLLMEELGHGKGAEMHFEGIDEMIAMCKKEIESLDKLEK